MSDPGNTIRLRRLHLGCGLTTPEGWLNVDGSWNARLAKHPRLRALLVAARLVPRSAGEVPWSRDILIHDLAKPLPFANASFHAVYSSHTLEHLYLEDTQALLRECHRVLAPGGAARMVVPDLRSFIQDYLGERSVWWPEEPFVPRTAADRFNRNLSLRPPAREGASALHRLYRSLTDFRAHKWMFDAESLAFHMREAGFVEVEERPYLDSRISGIEDVERSDRILNGQGVAVEGVKAS
jgi:SAM-dependent methyltransferase